MSHRTLRRPRFLLAAALAAMAVGGGGTWSGERGSPVQASGTLVADDVAARGGRKPNVVFILADDMSTSLLRHMPHTRKLIFDRGARFTRFHTNISMCCPARATLFTGRYAHNTGIVGNSFPYGFHGFHTSHERKRTFAVTLRRRARYRTALLGKYLNEYPYVDSRPRFGVRPTFVPSGWSDWAVPVSGEENGLGYTLNRDGTLRRKSRPTDYLSDLLTRRALRHIRRNQDGRGMALLLSFQEPHTPEPASPKEKRRRALRKQIAELQQPRTPDFNEVDVRDKPPSVRRLSRLSRREVAAIDRVYRRRVLSVKTIDRHVEALVRSLRRTGQLGNTYIVFSSDNGFHLGAHRIRAGKNTPYLTDTRVPFAIRGPGIVPGTVVGEVTGNIDVAPTLADMAGTRLPFRHDGESLLPLARGRTPAEWRSYYFIQRGVPLNLSEPARRLERRASPAARFVGVIGQGWEYVRYARGAQELYDLRADRFQLENLMAVRREDRTEEQQAALREARRAVRALVTCSGVADCRR